MISFILPNRCEPKVSEVIDNIELLFPGSEAIVAVDRYCRGKGWAVREAIRYAQGDIICLLDADMDIHPRMVKRLLPFLADYDIVIGRKQIRGLLSRRIITLFSRLWVWLLFGLNIDTQTGVKVFKRPAIPVYHTNGYMFDLEILSKARKAGFSIIEVPVEVTGSKRMKLKSIIKCFIETINIRLNND